MTHNYTISNMTCQGCVEKVKSQLLIHPDVLSATVKLEAPQAIITMQKHLTATELQAAIGLDSKYRIQEDLTDPSHNEAKADTWFKTYKPLLLIFLFITVISHLASNGGDKHVDISRWMSFFMAGFFLVFSFFKFLDLKGFADSYSMYDLLAKRIKAYGYIYPFIELTLGLAYLTGFNPVFTNSATIIVMSFSSIGVIQSVVNKKQIRCACLGAVFNLPMSTVTIIEDLLMIVMAAASLFQLHYSNFINP